MNLLALIIVLSVVLPILAIILVKKMSSRLKCLRNQDYRNEVEEQILNSERPRSNA